VKCTYLLFLAVAQACDVPLIRPLESGTAADGVVVAATNLTQSANVGLMSLTGQVLSRSLISTASHPPELTTVLGGDLAFPSMAAKGREVVILDRYPRSVLTWVNVNTANVRAQLSVATGFLANPHDYVPILANKVYVSRFDPNTDSGQQPFDSGSDILIVDPGIPAITGRIDIVAAMPKYASFIVHPDRARLVGNRVYIVLPYYDLVYNAGPSYVASIDPETDQIVDLTLLESLSGCSGLDVAPDESSIAVACSGGWHGSNTANSRTSGIVGVQLQPKLSEIWRIRATTVGNRAFGFEVGYVDARHVVAPQLGESGPPLVNDAVFLIDTTTGGSTMLLESADVPVTLSVGPCDSISNFCFIADAQRKSIHRLSYDGAQYSLSSYSWTDPTGLPPRLLSFF